MAVGVHDAGLFERLVMFDSTTCFAYTNGMAVQLTLIADKHGTWSQFLDVTIVLVQRLR
jgi:hypothetical protein